MNYREKIDLEKQAEYFEVSKIIKETVEEKDRNKAYLNSHILRTLAGYTEQSTDENFNPYVKRTIDKLMYDEHNQKVQEAKDRKDKEELKRLSKRAMQEAGYITEDYNQKINPYFRSFVDRTFFDRKISQLYNAKRDKVNTDIDQAYLDIFNMTSYSQNRPYGVVNQYAQTFVDNSIDIYIEKGFIEKEEIDDIQRAI